MKYRIAPGYRLQWENAQDRHVLLYPEGLVELDEPAAAVLGHLVEPSTLATLIANLESEYEGVDLSEDVQAFVEEALGRGWVTNVS